VVCAKEKTPQHETNTAIARWNVRLIEVSFLSTPDEQTPDSGGFLTGVLREGISGELYRRTRELPNVLDFALR
jgi:hypothetical protein